LCILPHSTRFSFHKFRDALSRPGWLEIMIAGFDAESRLALDVHNLRLSAFYGLSDQQNPIYLSLDKAAT
jgi:hypothetical protein